MLHYSDMRNIDFAPLHGLPKQCKPLQITVVGWRQEGYSGSQFAREIPLNSQLNSSIDALTAPTPENMPT